MGGDGVLVFLFVVDVDGGGECGVVVVIVWCGGRGMCGVGERFFVMGRIGGVGGGVVVVVFGWRVVMCGDCVGVGVLVGFDFGG